MLPDDLLHGAGVPGESREVIYNQGGADTMSMLESLPQFRPLAHRCSTRNALHVVLNDIVADRTREHIDGLQLQIQTDALVLLTVSRYTTV